MKKILIVLISLILISCKDSIQIQREVETPASFIKISEHSWQIDQNLITGQIRNTAKYSTYGNIVIIAEFLNKEGTTLGTERFVRFALIEPGKTGTYKFKVHPPEATAKVTSKISSAQKYEGD